MSFGVQFLARVYVVAMVTCLCSCRPHLAEFLARNRVRRQSNYIRLPAEAVSSTGTSTTQTTTAQTTSTAVPSTTGTTQTSSASSSSTMKTSTPTTTTKTSSTPTTTKQTSSTSTTTTTLSNDLSSSTTVPTTATTTTIPTTELSSSTTKTTPSTTTTATTSTQPTSGSVTTTSTAKPSTTESANPNIVRRRRNVNSVSPSTNDTEDSSNSTNSTAAAVTSATTGQQSRTSTAGSTTPTAAQSASSATETAATTKQTESPGVSTSQASTSSTASTSTSTTVAASTTTSPKTDSTTSTTMTSSTAAPTTSATPTTTVEAAQQDVVYHFSFSNFAIGEEEDATENQPGQGDNGRCPLDFIEVNNNTCYCPLSDRLDWWQAGEACSDMHPEAFPVAINSKDEQLAVHAVSSLLDYETCPSFWTSGQRVRLSHPSMTGVPLVWKQRAFVWQTMLNYENWSTTGPSPSDDCLYVVSPGNDDATAGEWHTGPCVTLRCVVCELPIVSVD